MEREPDYSTAAQEPLRRAWGSVIHQLLEEAGRGRFSPDDASSIEDRWRALVDEAESTMFSSHLERHLVPLDESIPDFEVRRIQAHERALQLSAGVRIARPSLAGNREYGFELPVWSTDGLVRGQIDAVIPSDHGPVVRDYKSGAVLERGPSPAPVKESYAIQLRLYAALYASTTGMWPSRLEIVPILGEAQAVEFDEETCASLSTTRERDYERRTR